MTQPTIALKFAPVVPALDLAFAPRPSVEAEFAAAYVGPPGSGGGGGGPTSWDAITGKPTTLSGFGITDAASDAELAAGLTGKVDKAAGKGLSTEDYSTAEKAKLAGIAAGATANSSDATLLARANHTGTQAISTVAGLQTALDGKIASTEKGAAGGVATLDENQQIPESQIPAVAITDTYEVASEAAMLALFAQRGDVAVRSDENKSYILRATPASTLSNWSYLRTPTDAVLSVAGKTGAVSLDKSDVGLGNVDNTSDANKPVSTAQQSALDGKEPTIAAASSVPTGKYWRGDKSWQDFAGDVRAAVLTGLSTATNAAVTATDTVLSALGKLQAQITGHTSASSGAHAATAISNTPAGSIAATTVQAALNELDSEKQPNLVSGANIKTAGGQNLVGSGDAPITAPEVHAAASKATPVDADEFGLVDSASSFSLRRLTFLNLKTTLLDWLLGRLREKLTSARAYYVRSDGSDSNTGLANTSGGAFLTNQKAVDTVAALDLGIYDVTIYIGTGTWTAATTLKSLVGAGKVIIRGVNADNTSTVISTTSAPNFSGTFQGVYQLEYMKLQTTTAGNTLQVVGAGSVIRYQNVNFGASAGNHVYSGSGAYAVAVGPYSITGGANAHMAAVDVASAAIGAVTVTLTGTPAFPGGFLYSGRASSVLAASVTFSGAATGKRYAAESNGVITTLGGATFLPGDTAGTTATGGVYQ